MKFAELKFRGRLGFAVLGAVMAAVLAPSSAEAASDTVTVNATMVDPIGITGGQALSFGFAKPSGASGTVVVATAGTRTQTGGVTLVGGGTMQEGMFTVNGEAGAEFTIAFGATTITSGGNNMTVNTFAHDAGATPVITGGSLLVRFGGTLNAAASQPAGAYTGTTTVTVAYQ